MNQLVEKNESSGWRKWTIWLKDMNHVVEEDESSSWRKWITWSKKWIFWMKIFRIHRSSVRTHQGVYLFWGAGDVTHILLIPIFCDAAESCWKIWVRSINCGLHVDGGRIQNEAVTPPRDYCASCVCSGMRVSYIFGQEENRTGKKACWWWGADGGGAW